MARRKVKVELTLFPFLSVLAGLIAVLILFMIVTVGTGVIDAEEVSGQRPDEGGEDGIDAEEYERFHQEIMRLTEELVERLREHEKLVQAVQQLEDLIEAKQAELAMPGQEPRRKGIKLGAPTEVNVIQVPAKGRSNMLKPILVEVSATGYVIHPEKVMHPEKKEYQLFVMNGKKQLEPDPDLAKFLVELNKRKKEYYLVLLIHPNGVGAFRNLGEFIEEKYSKLDIGYEPFSHEWILKAK